MRVLRIDKFRNFCEYVKKGKKKKREDDKMISFEFSL